MPGSIGADDAQPRLRLLFVSGTSVGGAARSTHELAAALHARGHHVVTLTTIDEAARTRLAHDRLLDASVRAGRAAVIGRPLRAAIDVVRRRVGRRRRVDPGRPYAAWRAAQPEHALGGLLAGDRFDAVVVNSIDRPAWREIRGRLAAAQVPSVYYLRERTTIDHVGREGVAADRLLANATGHAEAAAAAGAPGAVVIPSIVDLGASRVASTRERVVFVNPVPLFGLDIALALAAARPDVPFTFARSWPLDPAAEADLAAAVAALPNVVVAERVDDVRDVYRTARVVLVPYRHPGRPRVVAEAQASAIPVIGSDSDGTAEAIGPGGIVVPLAAPLDAWVAALARLWDDPDEYTRLVEATRVWGTRDDVDPERVVARFEATVRELLAAREVAS